MNQVKPMTFAELVDETVEYYTNNPRSFEYGSMGNAMCKYAGPNGERCAAARLCDESTDLEYLDGQRQPAWEDVCDMATLKPEYAHFTTAQIVALQTLHDRDLNWLAPYGKSGTRGLSSEGKAKVELIKAKF